MKREILWSTVNGPGLEHLRLLQQIEGVVAESQLITTLVDEAPLRLHYLVRCDGQWRVREVQVVAERNQTAVHVHADGEGHWTTDAGVALSHLDGCIDIDITETPFTNTLPIRRLQLAPRASAEISVAYVVVPSLDVVVSHQRYTCLESGPAGGRYRFKDLDTGYMNELPVDADGLVIEYPGIWQRVWPPRANS
jgi:hypothetical protein